MANNDPRRPDDGDDDGKLKTTRPVDLLALFVVSAIVVWLLVRVNYSRMPPLPELAGVVLYLLAAIEAVIAFMVRSRVADRNVGPSKGQLHPITAARILVLAKASALLGALASGVWSGILIYIIDKRSVLDAARHDTPAAVLGLVGALLLVAAALWLEHCCRAPDDPTPDGSSHPA